MPVGPKSLLRRNGEMNSHTRNRNRPAAPPERRFRGNVTNPAYITQVTQSQYRIPPAEALNKMKMLEHCDRAVINPMFHTPSPDHPSNDPKINEFISVDKAVINFFFGRGVPDYNKIKATNNDDQRSHIHTPPDNWVDQYPLHSAAYEGNATEVAQLLHRGYPADQPDVHLWVPLHYACWNGHVEAVKTLLLNHNCSPNTENDSGSTPLHFSAFKGHAEVVRLLLNHRDIDKFVVNKEGRTPLQLCEESRQHDWETTKKLLKEAKEKPSHIKIDVHLMDLDGSHVVLDLEKGSNTLIADLVQQLQLPRGGLQIFAVWIASQNLHLQMRPEHKPVLHLKQWDSIIRQLTNYNPDTERPLLYLKRDALLTVEEERTIRDPQAIKMLFDECLLNVLKGMYPCNDADVITLAGIYMQITYGDHDPKRHRAGFLNNINLRHFIPSIKLEGKGQSSRSTNWAQKIVNEHRNVTQKGIRDVTKLQTMYLEICRSFPVYGSAIFFGSAQLGGSRRGQGGSQRSPAAFVGVNSRGIHLINAISKMMILSVGYKQGLTWEISSDMQTLTLLIQDGNGYRSLPVKTKQAAIISNLANKLSGRMSPEDQPSTSRANSLQRH
ncbi:krev interaction trapped protein 1 [Strongylocentrotus purpuratus]|uniref:FERM domain-containing protein n=1 Tax=Strongylocentrotus purpuratus TaxID=7668 RepID=A0A7M7N2V4_STRPU|nr:krev interaction trapped protein 1 [Strongylocentrotus purpuratus]|eukprot:XP_011667295.1 PREDICTED: krev interaction trapped protein 1 isoform X2 [Strongylocentrotus purpuratus]